MRGRRLGSPDQFVLLQTLIRGFLPFGRRNSMDFSPLIQDFLDLVESLMKRGIVQSTQAELVNDSHMRRAVVAHNLRLEPLSQAIDGRLSVFFRDQILLRE